jgi:alpha-galactosidase
MKTNVAGSIVFAIVTSVALVPALAADPDKSLEKPVIPPRKTFDVEGHAAFVIMPKQLDEKTPVPWLWYAPTFPNLPEARENWMFERFLAAGIAIAGVDVGESYGSPKGRGIYLAFFRELVANRGFAPRAALLARSRGGLMLYNWASEHPEAVACIAGIYPVCDLRSYPGLDKACGAYGLTRAELEEQLDKHNPIARLAPLARAGVPIFHIHGDADTTVPLKENSEEVARTYEKLGGKMQLKIAKGQGHNLWEGFFQCPELVEFVISRTASSKEPKHTPTADKGPIKVFILAGQSNMEGKAPNSLLDHQATDAKTRAIFAHLRKDDRWIVRDDVYIKFLDRRGELTVGYGSPGRTGVELEFGTVMGDHFQEPVILVKAAWGGHSLHKQFRSPSAGYPAEQVLQKELDQAQSNVKKNNEKNNKNDPLPAMEDIKKQYGSSYRNMLAEVKDVMDNYATMFPALKGKTAELAGFVWFQGWNDQYGAQDEYESNMKHFINDVRKDLKTPKLPFVIGVMGQNGSKPATGAMLTIQKAQLAMNDVPEFEGNVKAIRTDVLVDKAAEELYPTWQKNLEEWKLTGGDHAYHYLGSAIWFNRIGHAMGEAMLELMKDRK